MFKLGNMLTNNDILDINENTRLSFGREIVYSYNSYDNCLIYKDNHIVSCAVIDINTFFIFNLCTHPNYRKQGLSKQLMNMIIEKYNYKNNSKALTLDIENNEKGIIPKQIYENLNWIIDKPNMLNTKLGMFYLPQTGILKHSNKMIKSELDKYDDYIKKNLDSQFYSILFGIIKYISDPKCNRLNFNLIKSIQNIIKKDNYLYMYKDNYNSNILFNHIIYLDNTNKCKQKISKIINNYKLYPYFVILIVRKNNFLLINKNKNNKEFISNKNIYYFNNLIKYINSF